MSSFDSEIALLIRHSREGHVAEAVLIKSPESLAKLHFCVVPTHIGMVCEVVKMKV